ncbi:probable ADP-ribosylation factor GTPase-activating protein AGD11 isoform X1 [Tanacetum coccineum]
MSTTQKKPDSENVSGHGCKNEGKSTQRRENVESCQNSASFSGKQEGKNTQRRENAENCQNSASYACKHDGKNSQQGDIVSGYGGKHEGKNAQEGENVSGHGGKIEVKNTRRKENVEICQISARDGGKHEGKNPQLGENVSAGRGCKNEEKNTQYCGLCDVFEVVMICFVYGNLNVEDFVAFAIIGDGCKHEGKNTQHGANVSGYGSKTEGKNAQHGENVSECGTQDPKWVSVSFGAFICIKCSGAHRSLGVHISKVLSVNLDDWTHEEVDLVIKCGGNAMVNSKYEASVPDSSRKPKSDSSIEDRLEFIRRKYEKKEFMDANKQICLRPSPSNLQCASTVGAIMDKKNSNIRRHSIGQAFRNSWRRKDTENKGVAANANAPAATNTTANAKTSTSMAGMVEFIGLIKVNVVKGTNLAVRDMITSDPYVILSLGNQSVKTRVIKSNLNPVWNEKLMLSIPDSIPPLKVIVYDRDTFKADDFMGDAEIDIQPLVSAAKASENSNLDQPSMQLEKWVTNKDNTLVKDGVITVAKGTVKQEISLKLQNVEKGVLEIELECVPLTQ